MDVHPWVEFSTPIHAQMPDERVAEAASKHWHEGDHKRYDDDLVSTERLEVKNGTATVEYVVTRHVRYEYCAVRRA